MNDSILQTVKRMIGIVPEDDHFDQEIIVHINTALATVRQIGFNSDTFPYVTDETASWSDITDNMNALSQIKTIVFLRVKRAFDHNASSAMNSVIDKSIEESEWRLNFEMEN